MGAGASSKIVSVGSPRPELSPPSPVLEPSKALRKRAPSSCLSHLRPQVCAALRVAQAPSGSQHVGKEYTVAAPTAWEGGLASSSPEATASSRTFARRAAGVGPAWAWPEPHRPHPTLAL